jgi:hypothetical protein
MFKDDPSGRRLEKVLALLIDGREPTEGLPPSRHFPFVRYRLQHVSPTAPADAFGLWPVHGTDLRIFDDTGDATFGLGPRLKQVTGAEGASPRTAEEETAARWLFDMQALGSEFAKVSDRAVTDQLRDVLPTVTTRVEIAGGELSTAEVVKEDDGRTPVEFQFVNGAEGPHTTGVDQVALAEEMLLSADVKPGKVTLERIGRITGTANYLELSPIAGQIELAILNLELDSILFHPRLGPPPRLVEEFTWFYRLYDDLATAPNLRPLPQAINLRNDNPYCPETQSSFP